MPRAGWFPARRDRGEQSDQCHPYGLEQRRRPVRLKTLQAFSDATGQDRHSVLVDYDVFQKASAPDRSDPRRLYKPETCDFRLRPGSKAVDAGIRLPNINDDSIGRAPDLGAYESGQPVPHDGPR